MSTHAPTSPAEKHSDVMAPPSGQGVILHAAFAGVRRVPEPVNEPNYTYAPGTPARAELKARLKSMAGEKIEIPLIIGGREIRTIPCCGRFYRWWTRPRSSRVFRSMQSATSRHATRPACCASTTVARC